MKINFEFSGKFLILICGLPGTGKTKLGHTLKSELAGYEAVFQNDIRRLLGMKKMPAHGQEKVLRITDVLIGEYLRDPKIRGVIFESGNRFTFRRQQLYGIAASCRAKVVTIEVVCSEETSKKRIRTRKNSKEDGLLGDPADIKAYDRIKALWEDVESEDFKHLGLDHVSYVKYDTDKNAVERVIINKGAIHFIKKLEKIITNDSSKLRRTSQNTQRI